MAAQDMLRQMSDALSSTATVKSVFGEPIHVEGRTIVPVARVSYAFGGGFGSGQGPKAISTTDETRGEGEGGGGGGGVRAYPAGALEITASGTRFIPFPDARLLAAALGVGALVGGLLLDRFISKVAMTRSRGVQRGSQRSC